MLLRAGRYTRDPLQRVFPIIIRQHFLLVDLNLPLAGFQYGVNYHVNKPMSISEAHIKNGYLIMSAAEMMNLFRCIFLLVGPFVPQENSHCQLLIKLKQIMEIVEMVVSPSILI